MRGPQEQDAVCRDVDGTQMFQMLMGNASRIYQSPLDNEASKGMAYKDDGTVCCFFPLEHRRQFFPYVQKS